MAGGWTRMTRGRPWLFLPPDRRDYALKAANCAFATQPVGSAKGAVARMGGKRVFLSNPVSSVNAFPRLTRAGVTGLRRYGTSRHHAVRDSGQQHSVMALEGGMMRIRPAVAAVIVGAAVMATPAVATAAYPGSNGRIVFEQGGFIYSIRQDGSDRRQLTTDTHSRGPSWSPNGRSIVFHRAGERHQPELVARRRAGGLLAHDRRHPGRPFVVRGSGRRWGRPPADGEVGWLRED